jgi:parallel beta-helix repeat protein
MKLFLVVSFAISLANAGLAASYLVDQSAPNAADTNAGTEAAPFKTIQAAVSKAQPGDTVYVKNGTYRESILSTNQIFEQPNTRITLMAWPTHRPVVTGSDVVTNRFAPVRVALRKPAEQMVTDAGYDPDAWRKRIGVDGPLAVPAEPADATNNALDHAHAPFVGIYACNWTNFTSLVFADDAMLTTIGLRCSPERVQKDPGGFRLVKEWEGHDVSDMRPGSAHYDVVAKKLYVWLPDGSDPNRHAIEAAVRCSGVILQGTWTFSGFDVCHVQDGWKTYGETALVVAGHYPIIEDCRVTHNGLIGVIIHGWDGVLRHNTIAWNGVNGVALSLHWRLLIEGNDFSHNGWLGDVRCCGFGDKICSLKDTRILRNRFHDGTGLWCDLNVNNTLIAENLFENCGCGIYFEISRWGVIVNNVFRNCAVGVRSYSADALIANNVFDGCSEGITIMGYPRACCYQQSYYDATSVPFEGCQMAVRNNLVVNNIVIDAPGSYVAATRDDAYGSANFSDYNVFAWTMPKIHWGSNHIKFMAGWDDYYGRLQFWRMARHYDEHSIIADPTLYAYFQDGRAWPEVTAKDIVGDPQFRDRASGDYRLRPDSPLRGKGITVPAVLNSTYVPAKDREINSRAWANTFIDAAPANRKRERSVSYGQKNYRIQPMPRLHRLVDLDQQVPADPGLNAEWLRTGQYPRFRGAGPPETVPDDFWVVFPENRLKNPDFNEGAFDESRLVDKTVKAPTGAWAVVAGQVQIASGEARAALSVTSTPCVVAQRLGPIQPDMEYVLWADTQVESSSSNAAVRGYIGLAAGPNLAPLNQTPMEARDGRTRHWNTVEAYYRSGVDGKADAHVGQDLYVVFGAAAQGGEGSARWDNFILLSGEPPAGRP